MALDPKAPPAPDLGPPAEAPRPFLWCSDCRASLRHYFALDERPICARCRDVYAAKIARGTGPRALWRAATYGLGAALAGAALLGIIIQVMGFGRILCAIAIGWMVAKAINQATGEYLGRRYRIMAVVFTYFAVGFGSLSPIFVALATMPDDPPAAEMPAADPDGDEKYADEELASLDQIEAELRAQRELDATSPEERAAADLAKSGILGAVVAIVLLILTLPLLSIFTFGIYGAVVGLFALGYGIWNAWEMTGRGVDYTLSGPHRVGTGPIPVGR